MANFTFKALNKNQKIVEGTLSGKNREEIAQLLEKRGLSTLVVRQMSERIKLKGNIPLIDKMVFCRYLSVMLASGLSLSEGVEVLYQETKQPLMRRILGDMSYSLEQGQSLSNVFERYPNVFESYFLTLTKAGEVSGTLAEVFKYLETELRAEYNLSSKIKGALLYPAIVFSAMIGVGVMMFFYVLPQIGKVFLNLKMPLPAFTRWLFKFSLILSDQMVPILVTAVLLVIAGYFLLQKHSPAHHHRQDIVGVMLGKIFNP